MNKDDFMYYIVKLFTTIQNSWVGSIIVGALSFFSPVQLILKALLWAVGIDLIFGIWASRKAHKPITSRRARKSAIKTLCYVVLVLLLYALEITFLDEWAIGYKVAAGLMCLTEVLSIGESMVVISDGHPAIKAILRFIRGKSEEKFGSLKDDISEEKNYYEQ